MSVSLAMIVRNEESTLDRCLASVEGLVEEIVVVDTGSTDGTIAVAESFGARVSHFTWCDDFAAARNEALRHATGDWVLVLDGDEWFDDENRRAFLELRKGLTDEFDVAMLWQRSVRPSGEESRIGLARLVRNRPEVRWTYRVHEQVLPSVRRFGGKGFRTDVVFDHSGYATAEQLAECRIRNHRLAELDHADRPDDPCVLFHLGRSCLDLGEVERAVALLRASIDARDGATDRPPLDLQQEALERARALLER